MITILVQISMLKKLSLLVKASIIIFKTTHIVKNFENIYMPTIKAYILILIKHSKKFTTRDV